MILCSHGDKGGSGKSMLASLAVDTALVAGRDVRILEGDLSQPDVAPRYAGIVRSGALNLNRSGAADDAVNALGTWVEQEISPETLLVINLPAAAGDTLDQAADMLASVFEALGHDLTVTYSTGMSPQSADVLARSLDAGLMSVASRRAVLLPEVLGQPDAFAWRRSPKRKAYLQAGGVEAVLPALRPLGLRDKVVSLKGPFEDLCGADSDLLLIEKAQLRRWLRAVREIIDPLIQEGETDDDAA